MRSILESIQQESSRAHIGIQTFEKNALHSHIVELTRKPKLSREEETQLVSFLYTLSLRGGQEEVTTFSATLAEHLSDGEKARFLAILKKEKGGVVFRHETKPLSEARGETVTLHDLIHGVFLRKAQPKSHAFGGFFRF